MSSSESDALRYWSNCPQEVCVFFNALSSSLTQAFRCRWKHGEVTTYMVSIYPVVLLFVLLVLSRFGFEGWSWVLIASVPDLCILFTFLYVIYATRNERWTVTANGGLWILQSIVIGSYVMQIYSCMITTSHQPACILIFLYMDPCKMDKRIF